MFWLWPGLVWLWLAKIPSQANFFGLGLAWPGFGLGQGFAIKFLLAWKDRCATFK
jgi:hypothetical protein